MCSSKPTRNHHQQSSSQEMEQPVARIKGRLVLQPTCNRLERRNPLKKITNPTASPRLSPSPPISPKPRSPVARTSNPSGLDKVLLGGTSSPPAVQIRFVKVGGAEPLGVDSAGSIAAARREEVANLQVLRKMRIAHYGRRAKKSGNGGVDGVKVEPEDMDSLLLSRHRRRHHHHHHHPAAAAVAATGGRVDKRCNFITHNSDPVYVTYHDEEWGVPVHDDKLLFELLVLTAAQVGSDWTSVLKRREHFRDAFAGFDADTVATFGEKKVASISCDCGIELSLVRGAVENAKQILKIREGYGSFDKYIWRYVNFKPISTEYKTCQKILVKTSKSEAISKDLVRRGFRFVGPAVIHSFMQAAGLTNDHLTSCPRHVQCAQLGEQR